MYPTTTITTTINQHGGGGGTSLSQTLFPKTEAAAAHEVLSPWIPQSSLSNDKPIKTILEREKGGGGGGGGVGVTVGTFRSQISLIFMQNFTRKGKRKKEGRNEWRPDGK